MRKLDRYVISTVFAALVLVLVVVLSLDLVFAFINELDELENQYQTLQALSYIAWTLPRRIYDYLPLAAFMGSLVGLGALANNSELVVMRAAGISTGRIVWAAMKPALVVVVIGLALGEYVVPHTERVAQTNKSLAKGTGEALSSREGFWHREGDTFMHFNAVEPHGVLHGVTLMEFDENRWLTRATFAQRAIYEQGRWRLEQVVQSDLAQDRISRRDLDMMEWDSRLSPEVLGVLVVKPENLPIQGLYAYSRYLLNQDLNANNYLMAFWKKVLSPVATAVMVLVAISFVFGPLRSVTMGFRVFAGIIVGLLFKYAQDLLGPSSLVFGFNPIFATLVPILVCFVVGVVLLRRAS